MPRNPDLFLRLSRREAAFCALAFFGLWLGFPNDFFELPLLVLLWPAACALLGEGAQNAKKALLSGWLAAFPGAAACLYWLYMPVHEVGGLGFIPALACALLIAFAAASLSGLFSLAAHFLKNVPAARRAICLGLVWYLLEWLYARLAGFPWLTPSGALAAQPLFLQIAAFCGAYAADGVWIGAILLCAYSLPHEKRKFRPRIFCAALGVVCLVCACGIWRLNEDYEEGAEVRALLVEGSVDQNRKWDPAFQRRTLELYMNLTEAGLRDSRRRGVDAPLVIWPETALPFFYEADAALSGLLRGFVREERVPLLFGAPGAERRPGEREPLIFNRAFLLDPAGALLGSYDKVHLVPFGEYVPAWLKLGFLEALLQGVGVYEAGTDASPLRHGPLALGMLICYEGIFPHLAQERISAGANLLVDISNDGWFGRSPAGRQHLLLTVPRCIEQGRWLLRATNTGISAVIDPAGRIVMRGPLFTAGALPAQARLAERLTPYHHVAPFLPGAAAAMLACLGAAIFTTRKRNRS